MSEHRAEVRWNRNGAVFTDNRYSRVHTWEFDGGVTVPASPSPHIVPPPFSEAANVDPEEAFIAALSSCHMLFFLEIAAKSGFVIESYADRAVGRMAKNTEGKFAITQITLNPEVACAGDDLPDAAAIAEIHHQAHSKCFLANSVKTEIVIAAIPPRIVTDTTHEGV